MQTPLTTLIEQLDREIDYTWNGEKNVVLGLMLAKKAATALLPEERKGFCDAFVAGDNRGTGEIPFNAEQWFDQTYTETKNEKDGK